MPYSKRYAGGFKDKPDLSTPIDATFLNAVEDALLKLFGVTPATNGAMIWDGTQFTAANKLTNAQIDAAAAIAKSKLDLAGQITDADIAGAAAISRSKLNFGSGLVNADIAAAAAIADSKIAFTDYSVVARATASQSIPNSTYTYITLDSEESDPQGMHDPVTNNTRLTFAKAGTYIIGLTVEWAPNSTGARGIVIQLNRLVSIAYQGGQAVGGGVSHQQTVSTLYTATAGDYVEFQAWQNSGGPLNITKVNNYSPRAWAAMIP